MDIFAKFSRACGVVLYIMLCGRFPFWGKSDIEYLASLRRGPDMGGEEWANVSEAGKGFVRTLLELEPKRRPTALQALNLPWILRSPLEGPGALGRLESKAGIMNVKEQQKKKAEVTPATQYDPASPVTPTTGTHSEITGTFGED